MQATTYRPALINNYVVMMRQRYERAGFGWVTADDEFYRRQATLMSNGELRLATQ